MLSSIGPSAKRTVPAALTQLRGIGDLPKSAEVVVVGGGIAGISTAYELTQRGVKNVVLLEQNSLTSGTTWHAAGLCPSLKGSEVISKMAKYGTDLYRSIQDSGTDIGWHNTGSLSIARSQDTWHSLLRNYNLCHGRLGQPHVLVRPEDIQSIHPFVNPEGVVGAIHSPQDGIVNPADCALQVAAMARQGGAKIFENVRVTGFEKLHNSVSAVETSEGTISCGHVVLCTGVWSMGISKLLYGVNRVPICGVPHQYAIFDKVNGGGNHLPVVRDVVNKYYLKPEVGGFMLGIFEADPLPHLPEVVQQRNLAGEVEPSASHEVFEQSFDKFGDHFEAAMENVPELMEIGLKDTLHGPDAHSIDHSFVMGRMWDLTNAYVGTGFNSQGIQCGPGVGRALTEWIYDGHPSSFGVDFTGVDIQRFYPHLAEDTDYVMNRASEGYGKLYDVHYPREFMESSRGRRLSPIHDRLAAKGAVLGEAYGWERALYFLPEDPALHKTEWHRRGNAAGFENGLRSPQNLSFDAKQAEWFLPERRECLAARNTCVVFDLSAFGKFKVTGPDAERAMQHVCTADIAKGPGALSYTFACNEKGGIVGDLTVAQLGDREFYMSTIAAQADQLKDHFSHHLKGDVEFSEITSEKGVLAVMGPNSRSLLSKITSADLSNEAFPPFTCQQIEVAGVSCWALRVSFIGEMGWELHIPSENVGAVYDELFSVSESAGLGLHDAGSFALLESLRLEKSFLHFGHEFSPLETPNEVGALFACKMKTDIPFIGRSAIEQQKKTGVNARLVTLHADVGTDVSFYGHGHETLYRNDEIVGFITSGGYSHTLDCPIGLAFVRSADGVKKKWIEEGRYEVETTAVRNGEPTIVRVPVQVTTKCLVDPKNERMKGIYPEEDVVDQQMTAHKAQA